MFYSANNRLVITAYCTLYTVHCTLSTADRQSMLKTCVYVEYIVEYFLCKVANLELWLCANISKTAEFKKIYPKN